MPNADQTPMQAERPESVAADVGMNAATAVGGVQQQLQYTVHDASFAAAAMGDSRRGLPSSPNPRGPWSILPQTSAAPPSDSTPTATQNGTAPALDFIRAGQAGAQISTASSGGWGSQVPLFNDGCLKVGLQFPILACLFPLSAADIHQFIVPLLR